MDYGRLWWYNRGFDRIIFDWAAKSQILLLDQRSRWTINYSLWLLSQSRSWRHWTSRFIRRHLGWREKELRRDKRGHHDPWIPPSADIPPFEWLTYSIFWVLRVLLHDRCGINFNEENCTAGDPWVRLHHYRLIDVPTVVLRVWDQDNAACQYGSQRDFRALKFDVFYA